MAINEFLDFNLIEENGGMSEYAKVALAFYFDLRGNVGDERFEKDLRKKLEAIMIEEADLDLDEDHTEFDLESEYSRANREDVFKRQLYKKMLAKYGAENLKDPEVRNKFTNEVTMAMMQERLDRLEAKMEESTIVDKLEGAWKWCNQAKSVLLPGLATLGLFGSYMTGGIGALFTAMAGDGTMIATGMSAVGEGILGYAGWTAAYGVGATLALGKTLQAASKIGLPPFLKGNQNLDEAAFEVMQHGGNLSLRNGEVQVANVNEGDKGNKKQVRNLRRQFMITRKEIMKNSRDTVRDNLGSQSKSSLILDTINNAYNVSDFESVNRVKKSNKRTMHMAGSIFAGIGHVGFLGATALLPAIYKRMK